MSATPAPPLLPPEVTPLPNGQGAVTIGQWLLSGTVAAATFYDTNIYSSPTPPILHGPGFDIRPALLADFNTGIFETQAYGNFDSRIYPTLDSSNNTFDPQVGIIQKYSPLRDLIFTVQANYFHATDASVVLNSTTPAAPSIPGPITSPANPALTGAAGVVAPQQTVVDPNDTYTATANVYKEFNRAFASLGTTISATRFETDPFSNYNLASYNGSGGIWFSPLFYAFANGAQSYYDPAEGLRSTYYFARGGVGSDRIGMFQGSIYAGEQGSVVAEGGGTAGGDLYGGTVFYFPTELWNMSLEVDRLRNISNITTTTSQTLSGISGVAPGGAPGGSPGGLAFAAVGLPTNKLVQVTTVIYRTNYAFSPQTSAFAVVSATSFDYIGTSQLDYSWFASLGILHQLRDNLTLNLNYNYTRYISNVPSTSFNRDVISLGAIYRF